MNILDQMILEDTITQQEIATQEAYQEIWEQGYEAGQMGIPLKPGCTDVDFLDGYVAGLRERVYQLRYPQYPIAEDCGF